SPPYSYGGETWRWFFVRYSGLPFTSGCQTRLQDTGHQAFRKPDGFRQHRVRTGVTPDLTAVEVIQGDGAVAHGERHHAVGDHGRERLAHHAAREGDGGAHRRHERRVARVVDLTGVGDAEQGGRAE